jgi:uncharacterized protein (TIGR02246 family)
MSDLAETVAALARRVARLEDELAVQGLCIRYGFAVDRGDADAAAAVFTDDGVYDVDVGRMDGRDAVAAMVRGARHQAMVGHCAHQIGPLVVDVTTDTTAVVRGYSRVYLQTPAGTHVYRVSCNRWDLIKRDGEWAIARRTTRVLGTPDGTELLDDVSRPAAPDPTARR